MTFQVQPIDSGKWELVLVDEPSYVHALMMAPDDIEKELKSGRWLIVVFSIWSGPVRKSVRAAIDCAVDFGGKFQIGLRPSDRDEEIFNWWPGEQPPSGSAVVSEVRDLGQRREIHISTDVSSGPIWLVLQDGTLLEYGAGPLSKEQFGDMMRAIFHRLPDAHRL